MKLTAKQIEMVNAVKALNLPELRAWSEEVLAAKVRLWKCRSVEWAVKSAQLDAEIIRTGPKHERWARFLSTLPEGCDPMAAPHKAPKAKAKATRPKRAVKVS